MGLDASFTRRTLLRAGAMSGALAMLARLRALPAAAAAPAAAGLRVLGPRDARILTAIAERLTFTGEASMPRFGETGALQTIDAALLSLPPEIPQQLSWALVMFEYGPPIFLGKASGFSGLPVPWQDVYLADWSESRFATRRLAFQAFKNLTMLGYYSQDVTWPAIHYQGPWAPRPRRAVDGA